MEATICGLEARLAIILAVVGVVVVGTFLWGLYECVSTRVE